MSSRLLEVYAVLEAALPTEEGLPSSNVRPRDSVTPEELLHMAEQELLLQQPALTVAEVEALQAEDLTWTPGSRRAGPLAGFQ